jgi:hypothetical protein
MNDIAIKVKSLSKLHEICPLPHALCALRTPLNRNSEPCGIPRSGPPEVDSTGRAHSLSLLVPMYRGLSGLQGASNSKDLGITQNLLH